ncbi:MAG: LysE family transporter, partial [Roseicyclus sp.]|nr:LysE family transporter [Roseicyclus sp.]
SHDIEAIELAGGRRTPWGYLRRGYVIQMTNPKAALAWIAIISLGLQNGAPVWVGAAIVLGTFALSISIHLFYAVAFSTPVMVRLYGRARRGIQGVLGTFFAYAGIRLLTDRG